MNSFREGKYYVASPPCDKWSDYEGPFDSEEEAVEHLKLFINDQRIFSPEMLGMVVVSFSDNVLDLVKRDGAPLNGAYLYWKLK